MIMLAFDYFTTFDHTSVFRTLHSTPVASAAMRVPYYYISITYYIAVY